MKLRWFSLSSGMEASWHQAEQGSDFHGASGDTRSLYLSGGQGRWFGAAGFSSQRIEQDFWSYNSSRRMGRLSYTSLKGLELLAEGYSVSENAGSGGWQFGMGLGLPLPGTVKGQPKVLLQTATGQSTLLRETEIHLTRLTSSSLTLSFNVGTGRLLDVGIINSYAAGEQKFALLLKRRIKRGRLSLHGSFLKGHLHGWFDGDRLVIHDNREELKSALSAGVDYELSSNLTLHASMGREEVPDREFRWVYAGIRWTWRKWLLR